MILIEHFGYVVENVQKKDASQVFKIFSKDILDHSEGEYDYLKQRRELKQEVMHMFDSGEYSVVGIRNTGSDQYLGMFVSNDRDDSCWLGYFSILKEYRKKRITVLLAHYLFNILYKDKVVQIGHFDRTGFAKHIKSLQKSLGISIFLPSTAERIAKLMNRGI